MALAPFQWGQGGQKLTPAQVAQRNAVAEKLLSQTQPATTFGGGLARIGDTLRGIHMQNEATSAAEAHRTERQQILDSLMSNPDPSMQDIFGALGNDVVSSDPASAAILQALLGQEIQQNDPLRQLQLEKGNLELEQMRGAQKQPIEVGGVLLDPDTYEPIFDSRTDAAPKPMSINDQLVDPTTGEVIGDYRDPPDLTKAPTVQKVLLEDGSEMAVQWDGATQQWIPINAPEGGGTLKPGDGLTEGQAKLTLFQSLQTETQPVLLDLEDQFNPGNLQDAAARSTPIAGNFFQSEQGQIYNSAATAWAEGALRIATGAAATPEEMERTKKAYFAQPGDTPNTIAFKAQMREMYNRAIQRSLGQETSGALPMPSEFAQQVGSQAAPEQSQANPEVFTGPQPGPDGAVDFSDYFK